MYFFTGGQGFYHSRYFRLKILIPVCGMEGGGEGGVGSAREDMGKGKDEL